MSKHKKVIFVLNEQLWKKVKTLQINSNVKSLNDVFVILSLQFVNGTITIPGTYDLETQLQNFLTQEAQNVET